MSGKCEWHDEFAQSITDRFDRVDTRLDAIFDKLDEKDSKWVDRVFVWIGSAVAGIIGACIFFLKMKD